jgi:hypothetical protein
VQRETTGYKTEDHPPTVAWQSPRPGTLVPASGPTMLTASATDDHAVAAVRFYVGGRALCDDTSAPYACAYQPQGGDVGNFTLLAVAVEAAGQTASALQVVVVDRFTPTSLTLQVAPPRDRTVPFAFTSSGRCTCRLRSAAPTARSASRSRAAAGRSRTGESRCNGTAAIACT